MKLNKHGSFYIRNGWPTKIIDAINKDGMIFSPNKLVYAVDQIGVGKIMVKSMRYWSTALGISYEQKNQNGVLHSFTDLGLLISRYDPYCQNIGTLWLLHRNLCRNIDEATAWSWAYNDFNMRTFTKDDFVTSFLSFLQRSGVDYPRRAVEKEFDCFKNTYVSDKKYDISKIIDEDTIPFFAPLSLIKYCGGGHFEKIKPNIKEIPVEVLLYCIIQDNYQHLATAKELDIDMLLENNGQVGRYLNLSYATLLELLQQLENKKFIKLINNFGNRYIYVENIDSKLLISNYYSEIEE